MKYEIRSFVWLLNLTFYRNIVLFTLFLPRSKFTETMRDKVLKENEETFREVGLT